MIESTKNRGTYIRPIKVGQCGSDKKEPLIEAVAKMLQEDPNSLKPGDFLYDAALDEYNKGIRATSTDRMPIPAGFCGIRSDEDRAIRVVPVDQAVGGLQTLTDDILALSATPIMTSGSWPVDKCLSYGPPGSYEYSLCGKNPLKEFIPESTIPRKIASPNFFIIAEEVTDTAPAFGEFGTSGELGSKSDVEGLPELFSLQGASVNGSSTVSFGDYTVPTNWPAARQINAFGELHMYKLVEDTVTGEQQWLGGKFEWIDPEPRSGGTPGTEFKGQRTKTLENIRNGYQGHTIPPAGTIVQFVVISVDRSARSDFAETVWP
jgi:hypothetical protein